MGTTLGMSGAYDLAGCLIKYSDDLPTAFAEYERKLRPTVEETQKLPLGGRLHYLINPATTWGLYLMRSILCFVDKSGLGMLMFRIIGPKADEVAIEDYGFKQAAEWKDY